jgi:hypothetical protein
MPATRLNCPRCFLFGGHAINFSDWMSGGSMTESDAGGSRSGEAGDYAGRDAGAVMPTASAYFK